MKNWRIWKRRLKKKNCVHHQNYKRFLPANPGIAEARILLRFIRLFGLALAGMFVVLAGCGPYHRPVLQDEEIRSDALGAFLSQKLLSFRAGGDIEAVVDGKKYKSALSIVWTQDKGLWVDLISPFGTPVGSIESSDSLLIVRMMDTERRVHINDSSYITMNFLPPTPFTFYQFIRILRGQLPLDTIPQLQCGPLVKAKKKGWRMVCDFSDYVIESIIDHKGLAYMIFKPADSAWEVIYSEFKDGWPHEIRYWGNKKNYITVTYNKIKREQIK
jgi:hypothetical protein